MLTKIYLGVVAVCVVISGSIWFYANSWLGSIGDPETAASGFIFQTSIAWSFLWGSFLILTGFALLLLVREKIKWPVWVSFGYFALGLLGLLINDSSFKSFLDSNFIKTETTLLNPFFVGVLLVIVCIALLVLQMLLSGFGKAKVVVKKSSQAEVEAEVEAEEAGDEKRDE